MSRDSTAPGIDQHTPNVYGTNGWVVVARGRQREQIETYALALAAVGIRHAVERRGEVWVLCVPSRSAGRARRQLVLYVRENRAWPPEAPPPPPLFPSPTMPLMALLVLVFILSGPWRAGSPWFAAGMVDRRAIVQEHEWWRLFTALTLHADIAHLAGNVVIGGTLVHFLARSVGAGLGWSLACAAGVLGNLTNVWFQDASHLSVGFSTAVFGAVGAFGSAIRARGIQAGVLLPLGGAAGLLALLGTAGQRTDLGAHLWGFGWGLLLGAVVVRPVVVARLAGRMGALLPWLWVAVFAGAWGLAWRAVG